VNTRERSRKKHEISTGNLIRHEVIGLRVTIVDSLNDKFIGFSGTLIDESRNMFKLRCEDNVVRMIPKEVCIFKFELPNGDSLMVDGRILSGRGEERIKMKKRKVVWPLILERRIRNVRFQPKVCEVLQFDP